MTEIRKLPAQAERVETGPVQFGDDWPGVFIRGDNAAMHAMNLEAVCRGEGGALALIALDGLRRLLAGAVVGPARELFKVDAPLDRLRGPLPPLVDRITIPPDLLRVPLPPQTPGVPLHDAPRCAACGLKLEGVMGYVCSRADCPTGLGGPRCAVSAQDPIIGN